MDTLCAVGHVADVVAVVVIRLAPRVRPTLGTAEVGFFVFVCL